MREDESGTVVHPALGNIGTNHSLVSTECFSPVSCEKLESLDRPW